MPLSLEELMTAAQGGDSKSYQKLLGECEGIARGYVKSRLSNVSEAEDVIQEILMSIHKARHTYQQGKPFKPWVYAICKYRLMDYLRSLYKKNAFESPTALDELQLPTSEDVTEGVINNELLRKALSCLNKKEQKIVTLMKIEGRTASEVALNLNMGVSAVKVAAHRAYAKMKKHMKDIHYDG